MQQRASNGTNHDLRRKMQLSKCSPTDHMGEVKVMPDDSIDLNQTIFRTLNEKHKAAYYKQFGIQLFWSDQAVARIEAKTAETLQNNPCWHGVKAHDPELIKFMENECDFRVEHTDGSFLDHLQYCYEFSAAHMPQYSAIPLFLHSIMGVGTNLFPMQLEQKDRLAQFVTKDELAHIEAFPTTLRLLQFGSVNLRHQLLKMSKEELNSIDGLECCRLLGPEMKTKYKSDNAPVKLSRDQFWVHLNYHLIHMMDFLPVENWEENVLNLQWFSDLHLILKRAGKLYCKIEFDSEKWSALAAQKVTPEVNSHRDDLKELLCSMVGHSLAFELKQVKTKASRGLGSIQSGTAVAFSKL